MTVWGLINEWSFCSRRERLLALKMTGSAQNFKQRN